MYSTFMVFKYRGYTFYIENTDAEYRGYDYD